jgi:DNA-binding transcriptional MocR family regulator
MISAGGRRKSHRPLAAADRQAVTNGLVLGFGAVSPDASSRGMQRLAAAIEAATRR